ncbi:hypothetical protein BC940DRAFT_289630 [Gongronella butleri]|nr:hypothetical protein BC940DRAFT_289630 [Gongronella butleri]
MHDPLNEIKQKKNQLFGNPWPSRRLHPSLGFLFYSFNLTHIFFLSPGKTHPSRAHAPFFFFFFFFAIPCLFFPYLGTTLSPFFVLLFFSFMCAFAMIY